LSSEENKCPSEIYWWDAIKHLALEFERKCDGKLELNKRKFDNALDMYKRSLKSFKECVYGEKADEKRMDRHKIIALYILSFLIGKPFSVKNPEDKKEIVLSLANELFSLAILETILPAFNEKEDFLEMKDEEKKWFVILLNYIKRKQRRTDILVISEKEEVSEALSISQIIYYIEKSYKPS